MGLGYFHMNIKTARVDYSEFYFRTKTFKTLEVTSDGTTAFNLPQTLIKI